MTTKRIVLHVLRYVIFTLLAIMMIFPIYWMVACSLMERTEVVLVPPHLYPH